MEEKKILELINELISEAENYALISTERDCEYFKMIITPIIKQLQLKDKMIELMAKDIIWWGSNKDKKSNGKQIDIVLSNYKQQALAELEE